ncbi:MAG: Cna B-type domain-containing protein, partial [Blautia sp.]|nr:Cna B-type domain-containing protein [Blautia sp.]
SENETPVSIIWKDGDNADGLRGSKLKILASTVGTKEQTYTADVTEEQNWKAVLNGDVYEVAPQWDSVIISTESAPSGTDTAGQYRYEAKLDGENGWVITLYHTPNATMDKTGTVTWDDADNWDGIRPQSMTVRLLADGEATEFSATVTGEGTYSFNHLAKYRHGEEILYTVETEEINGYTTTIEGTAITNTHMPSILSILTFVSWEDNENALGLRPESVAVRVQAQGEEAIVQTVNEEDSKWIWIFDDLPENGRGGGALAYTVTAEEVEGYTLTVKKHEDGYEFCYSLDKLSITFEAGEGASGTMAPARVDKDASYTLPENAFTAPEGKSFKEWSVKIGEEEEVAMKVGDTITVSANTTVTALWDALTPSFKTHSLILTGLIGINFYMNLPESEGVDYSKSYMEFSVSGKDGETTRDNYDPSDKNASGEYYGFTCYVSSIQMADTITATFHYGEGQSVTQTYSVARYIEDFAGVRDQFDEATIQVVQSMADYGYFMQPVLAAVHGWQIGTDHAEMTPYTASLANEESLSAMLSSVAEHAFDWNVDNSKIAELTFDLTLNSSITLRVFLKPEAGYEGEVTAFLNDSTENVAVKQADGKYVIIIPDISAHMLGQKYLVHGEADGEYYATLSALTYIDAAMQIPSYQGNAAMQNAMLALHNYYQAVMNYRASH